jgi:AraC-like DNA-binding protein
MTKKEAAQISAHFLASVAQPEAFLRLFDYLPRTYLFIKDARGRFIRANTGELQLHGLDHESEIVGLTDFDFHPPALAAQYVEEDQRVMKSGEPLVDQAWLVLGHDRMPRWYLCTKMPLFDHRGRAIGICGVMRPYDQPGAISPTDYHRLTPALEHVLTHYGSDVSVQAMAEGAHLSVSQLQREFQRLFGMTPTAYITKVRLLMARRRLEEGGIALGQIALDCGFYDQSHFTRTFREAVGLTPSEYRRKFGRRDKTS